MSACRLMVRKRNERFRGKDCLENAGVFGELGQCNFYAGRYQIAVPFLVKGAEIFERFNRPDDQTSVAAYKNLLGLSYWKTGDLPKGLALCQEAQRINNNAQHPDLLLAKAIDQSIKQCQKTSSSAISAKIEPARAHTVRRTSEREIMRDRASSASSPKENAGSPQCRETQIDACYNHACFVTGAASHTCQDSH